MASLTKVTQTRRKVRDAKLLKNRQKKFKRALRKAKASSK